jgi:hypothetical protein
MDTGKNQTRNEPTARRNDYLWDGSGEPDPEIRRLEALLGKFHHDRPAPVFPEIPPGKRWPFFSWRPRLFPVLATTGALGAIAIVTFLVYIAKPKSAPGAGWDVSRVAGTPRIGRNKVSGKETSRLGIGQVLETDPQSRASLRADNIGQIEV